jgi:hypothetical protein
MTTYPGLTQKEATILSSGDCPICGDVIVGNHRWEYLCKNCSLKFNFNIKGIYLISSENINESISKDIVKAALACKHLEIVIIREGEDDNSDKIREFLEGSEIRNCSISTVDSAPQVDTTAYLVYECCPAANVIFGEKNQVFDVMVAKHNMVAFDDPSMDKVNEEVEKLLSECCS